MQSIRTVIATVTCSLFLTGCNIQLSVLPDPATFPVSQPTAVSTNEKGATTVTSGVDESTYRLTTLPSGKKIKLIHKAPLHFTKGGTPPALMLKYRTDLQLADQPALLAEANEIWEDLRVEAEKGGYTSAVISAHDTPVGYPVWNCKTFTFVWTKDEHGEWQRK